VSTQNIAYSRARLMGLRFLGRRGVVRLSSFMRIPFLLILGSLCAGCPSTSQPPKTSPRSGLATTQPEKRLRVSDLLTFESPVDLVFVKSDGNIVLDETYAQTGRRSLKIPPSATRVELNLPSLMTGRPFPADWTLVCLFARCDSDATVGITYGQRSRMINLKPGSWSAVTQQIVDWGPSTDMRAHQQPEQAQPTPVVLTIQATSPVWIDDVTLVDNQSTLVGTDDDGDDFAGAFSFRRRGFEIVGGTMGSFQVRLAASEASENGWTFVDGNAWRIRLRSAGAKHFMTVWRDGRVYTDGQYGTYTRHGDLDDILIQQHTSPAQLDINEAQGRVDYNSAGDANNDGYAEREGVYQVVAFGPRLDIKMTPGPGGVARPILELSGLPPGKVIVTVEGRLATELLRLPDGHVLVELPIKIERPVTVKIRLE